MRRVFTNSFQWRNCVRCRAPRRLSDRVKRSFVVPNAAGTCQEKIYTNIGQNNEEAMLQSTIYKAQRSSRVTPERVHFTKTQKAMGKEIFRDVIGRRKIPQCFFFFFYRGSLRCCCWARANGDLSFYSGTYTHTIDTTDLYDNLLERACTQLWPPVGYILAIPTWASQTLWKLLVLPSSSAALHRF